MGNPLERLKNMSEEEKKKKLLPAIFVGVLTLAAIGFTVYKNSKEETLGEAVEDNQPIMPKPKPQSPPPQPVATELQPSATATATEGTKPQPQPQPQTLNQPQQPQAQPIAKPVGQQSVQPQPQLQQPQVKIDVVKGLPSDAVMLDYEIEKLEKQKKMLELKKQIEELEGKKRTTAGQELPEVSVLKRQLEQMKMEQEMLRQQAMTQQKKEIQPADESGQTRFVIKSIYCVNRNECNGVVSDGTGEYLVRAGSRLPSGLAVESITPDGIFFTGSAGRFFRPVDMSLQPSNEKDKKAGQVQTVYQPQQPQAQPVRNMQIPIPVGGR